MPFQLAGFTLANIAEVDAASKALRESLYDSAGNALAITNKSAPAADQGYLAVAGLDSGELLRPARVDSFSTLKPTSAAVLWLDMFDGATINAFWTQTVATQTITQAASVLTLNSSGITTVNTSSTIVSQRQFPIYPKQVLWNRWRINITANLSGNHTFVQFGFGSFPAANTVNGISFLWKTDGSLWAAINNNYVDQQVVLLPVGSINTTAYYLYDIIVTDLYARFLVKDSQGNSLVDTQVQFLAASPFPLPQNHVAVFAQVIVDGNGGGTAIKCNISECVVDLLDAQTNMTFAEQSAASMRSALINPSTWVQTTQLATTAAPAAFTPLNTGPGNATLGGEAVVNDTAASENLLAIFTFQIPSTFTLYLQRIVIPQPVVTTVIGATQGIFEWFVVVNATTNRLDTAGGQRYSLGIHQFPALSVVGTIASGPGIVWTPDAPICCTSIPGTGGFIHIGWKVLSGTATGVFRVVANVDGYWF